MDTNKLVSGHLSSLTGDPVDIGRGLTEEASQKLHREQNPHLYERGQTPGVLYVDDAPWVEGTVNHNSPGEVDEFAIPGLDPDAVAPNGVDAAADDSGCEGGACKI